MAPKKRCEGCLRPVCQRVLTLRGCKEKNIEPIEGESLNDVCMVDYVGSG